MIYRLWRLVFGRVRWPERWTEDPLLSDDPEGQW